MRELYRYYPEPICLNQRQLLSYNKRCVANVAVYTWYELTYKISGTVLQPKCRYIVGSMCTVYYTEVSFESDVSLFQIMAATEHIYVEVCYSK